MIHALAKAKSFIPDDGAKEIKLNANEICTDLSLWMGNRKIQAYLKAIKIALQESKLLTFEYVAHHGNKTQRTIQPYQLVLKSRHWYLQGVI